MKPFKTQAHIHSFAGQMDEITILKELGNKVLVLPFLQVHLTYPLIQIYLPLLYPLI